MYVLQCCGSGFIESDGYSSLRESGFGFGSRVLMTKNKTKNTGENVLAFFDKKLQFTYP
jgi:hypothetical protein